MNKKVVQEFVVSEDINERVDIYLASRFSLSRSSIQVQIKNNLVEVNGEKANPKHILKKGDKVCFFQLETSGLSINDIPILFEDKNILVINKPAGISTHPAPGEKQRTIYEIFENKFQANKNLTFKDDEYPLIVHRLDKGTSGVMVLAKNSESRESLKSQFKGREVNKQYVALLEGDLRENSGKIDLPIDRDDQTRGRFTVVQSGREAMTDFDVIGRTPGYTLVFARPKTGRTHQIRVHFSSIGFPLFGDKRYNQKSSSSNILLHAYKIGFKKPDSNEYAEYIAPLPNEYHLKLKELGFSAQTLSKLS